MKTVAAFLFSFAISPFAHAGAAYSLFITPDRPEIEICRDKFGMSFSVHGGASQEMNTVIPLELYATPDGNLKVERHPHDYGLDLIDERGQRHRLIRAGGGFGSCGFRE